MADVSYERLAQLARTAAARDEPASFAELEARPGRSLWEKLGDTWPARLARSAYDAVTLPGDAYAGRTSPDDPRYYERAADLAGLVMGGTGASAPAGAVGAGPVVRGGGVRLGGEARAPINSNVSQAQVREMIPEPLSRADRDWQNYGRHMTPEDVAGSEVVWGRAQLARDAGEDPVMAFADAANDLWSRMGANKYIGYDQAKRLMAHGEAEKRGFTVLGSGATDRRRGAGMAAGIGQAGERPAVTGAAVAKMPDETVVMVDPRVIDAAWQRDRNQYVGPDGAGGDPGKYARAREFLTTADQFEAPSLRMNEGGTPVFDDGRHRFAVMRDLGMDYVPVAFDPYSAELARRFGITP